jgi:predicted GIY-YIG superfamily endonuclease
MPFVYILRCCDDTLYVGHTDDLDARLKAHGDGVASNYTAARRPVELVYGESCSSQAVAVRREHQLKRWSAQKKQALIAGNTVRLKALSKRHRR